MDKLSQRIADLPKFEVLPPEFKECLQNLANQAFFEKDRLPKIEPALLKAINDGEITTGYSSIYPDRILPNSRELIVWEKTQRKGPMIRLKTRDQLILVYIDAIEKYELFFRIAIEGSVIEKSSSNIIKSPSKILPTIVKNKKKNQLLMGKLPCLGIQSSGGKFILFEKEISRPKYSKIISDKWISLKNCIRILLRIKNIELIAQKEKDLKQIQKIQIPGYDGSIFKEFDPAIFDNTLLQNTIKYRDEWEDIVTFANELINKITIEDEYASPEKFDCKDFTDHFSNVGISHIVAEHYSCYFKTSAFKKWAKDFGYEIPDESPFTKNKNGISNWDTPNNSLDLKTKGIDENNNLSEERKLHQFLMSVYPEVKLFYSGFIQQYKTVTGKNLSDADMEELKNNALSFYSKNPELFPYLEKEHIELDHIYQVRQKQKKAIIGKILKIILDKKLPNISLDPNVETNANSLYEQAQKNCP